MAYKIENKNREKKAVIKSQIKISLALNYIKKKTC